MKHLALAALLASLAVPAAADGTLSGVWRTATYDGEYAHVRMTPCNGNAVCGVVVGTYDKDGEIQGGSLGKTIVSNMSARGNGIYDGGRIRRPDTGQSAPLKMTVNGSQLQMSACIGPLCHKEIWQRVQ